MDTYIITAAAGTEDLLSRELRALGVNEQRQIKGGVRFSGTLAKAMEACLWVRTGMRVLQQLGSFEAGDQEALYEGVRRFPWNDFLGPRHTLAVDAIGTSETLRHTHFVGQRVKDAVCDVIRERRNARPSVDARNPDMRLVARLARGRCELSLDLSGEPLFKRGYRQDQTRAPLKETLAASVLLCAGYDGTEPLLDPMCGSGTLAIEAAMIARHRAPGLNRAFGLERWPWLDRDQQRVLRDLRLEARESERAEMPRILAGDRDPEAVQAARANVARTGLPVEVVEQDAREALSAGEPGWIVTNPPYGERLDGGGRKNLKTFFWQLGRAWRELGAQKVAVLSGGPEFESAFGARPGGRRWLYNGPILCELLMYQLKARAALGASEPAAESFEAEEAEANGAELPPEFDVDA